MGFMDRLWQELGPIPRPSTSGLSLSSSILAADLQANAMFAELWEHYCEIPLIAKQQQTWLRGAGHPNPLLGQC